MERKQTGTEMIAYDHDLEVLVRQMRARVLADFVRRSAARLRRPQTQLPQVQPA